MLNYARVIEDLLATMPLLMAQAQRSKPLHPSAAYLGILGSAFASAEQSDANAGYLRRDPFQLKALVTRRPLAVLSGRVKLSYFLASIAFARHDLHERFFSGFDWDWVAILQWLVLKGINENSLWLFLEDQFISELLTKTIHGADGSISPLQLCVIRERPDLRRNWPPVGSPEFESSFNAWLVAPDDPYGLFWLRSRSLSLESGIYGRTLDLFHQESDVLSNPNNKRHFAGAPKWPSDLPTRLPPHNPARNRTYGRFGESYPCISIDCLDPTLIEDGSWHGSVRLAPGRTHLELLGSSTELRFPYSWLSPGVIILQLEVHKEICENAWVRLSFDRISFDERPASAYSGKPVKVLVSDRPTSAAPTLRIQIAYSSDQHLLTDTPAELARLYSLQFWQFLRSESAI